MSTTTNHKNCQTKREDHTSFVNGICVIGAAVLLLISYGCNEAGEEQVAEETEVERAVEAEESEQVVEITATHDPEADEHLFELSDEEIPSGWTAFRLVNNSPDEHLAQIFRIPEDAGVTADVWIDDFIVEVQRMMERFQTPEVNTLAEAREGVEYPDWAAEISPRGGPGIISAGGTAEAMAQLEPGHYIIECYIKDENEMMHTALGMAALLIVTDEQSGAAEPETDIELTISDEGIQSSGNVEAGEQNIRVNFEERETPGYRNINLVRLDDGYRLEELSKWMHTWFPGGLVAPVPFEFAGGTGRKPAGQATYFSIDFEPGDYAWVSEYPIGAESQVNLEDKGLLKTFTVEP